MAVLKDVKESRELDAQISKELFGWEFKKGHCSNCSCTCGQHYEDCDFMCYFSSDIRSAWRIVEKFLPHIRIENWEDSDYTDKNGWHVDIWVDGGHACVEGAETAPLAIAVAGLEAQRLINARKNDSVS